MKTYAAFEMFQRTLILCIAAFSLSTIAETEVAITTKKELRTCVHGRLEIILQARASQLSLHSDDRINEIVGRCTELIELIPQDKVNEEMGAWICDSLIDLVSRQVDTLLQGGDTAVGLLSSITAQGQRTLPHLTENAAINLLTRRATMLEKKRGFHAKLLSLTADKLSNVEQFRLYPYADSLLYTLCSEVGKERDKTAEYSERTRKYSIALHDVHNKLLTLALVRRVASAFKYYADAEEFTINNFFSRAYEHNSPFQDLIPKDFEAIRKELGNLYESYFLTVDENNLTQISLVRIHQFLMAAEALHMGIEQPNGAQVNNVPTGSQDAYADFANQPSMWQILQVIDSPVERPWEAGETRQLAAFQSAV